MYKQSTGHIACIVKYPELPIKQFRIILDIERGCTLYVSKRESTAIQDPLDISIGLYVSKKDPVDAELGMQMYSYIHTTSNRNSVSS